jgi:hypothetical protein
MARRALRSLGRGLGLAGGQQWAQQPVVQLGVEDRDLDPVKGGDGTCLPVRLCRWLLMAIELPLARMLVHLLAVAADHHDAR